MATAAYSKEHTQDVVQDHTPAWAWVLDLVGLVTAISPALIYVVYLLTQ